MAIVQADIFLQNGTSLESDPAMKLFTANMGTIAALYQEPVHILVNTSSGITTVADLAGKIVNVGSTGSGTYFTASKILSLYGIDPATEPYFVNESSSIAATKVASGEYDATFYVAAAPISALANLADDGSVTLIPAAIPGNYSTDYTLETIPAGTYAWLDNDVENNATVWSLLTLGSELDRKYVGDLLDDMYANKDAYATDHHAKWALFNKYSSITVLKATPTAGWNREAVHYLAEEPMPTNKPQPFFCSASTTGTYTKVVKDLLPVVKDTLGLDLMEMNTSGSIDNLNKLYDGTCAIALMQDDMGGFMSAMDKMDEGVSNIMLKGQSVRAIMPLYAEQAHLIVNESSGIETSADLQGKKFNMAPQGSGSYMTASAMLLINGLSESQVIASYDSPQVALAKVVSGEYDAMFITQVAPVDWLVDNDCGDAECVPGMGPADWPIKIAQIESGFGAYVKGDLPAGTYPWQNGIVEDMPQMMATIFVSPDLHLDLDSVTDFIDAVYMLEGPHSHTWDQTNPEQGMAHFGLVTYLYDWYAGLYFAEMMAQQ